MIDRLVLGLHKEKVHSLILLSLFDEVHYEVSEELADVGLWLKLEKLIMTKSICNKLLLKRCLFSLQMREGTPLKEHLHKLISVLMELHDIDVKIEEEDLEMILLAFLPPLMRIL